MPANVILPESGAKRTTRIVTETNAGSTPSSAAWDVLRNTGGNGVQVQYETEQSEELGDGVLGVSGLTRVDSVGTFEYPFEYSNSSLFDAMLESIMESSFSSNTLVPGNTAKTFSIEDDFPTVRERIALLGARCNQFNLTVEAGAAVKGTLQGDGATISLGAQRTVAPISADIDFAASGSTITSTNATDPFAAVSVAVGDYVLITGAGESGNNGYYKITGVTTKEITVAGTLTDDTGDSPTMLVSPQTLYESTGGSVNSKDASSIFRAGSNVSVLLDGVDVLNFGLRIPSLELRINTPTEQGREITLDSPYITIPNDRQVDVTFQWHVVNLQMLRYLEADAEHTLAFTVGNGTHSRTFTLPRAKFAEGAPGAGGKGVTIMTGSSRMEGLLNGSNINLQVDRVTS